MLRRADDTKRYGATAIIKKTMHNILSISSFYGIYKQARGSVYNVYNDDVDTLKIIRKFYDPESKAYHYLVHHGKVVAHKALRIARRLDNTSLDISFIEESALLHDIGIIRTYAPQIGCFGYDPYITHGSHGREMLESIGLHRHALVCERHIGMGLTVDDIVTNQFPLPLRDMIPCSREEQIVCFADKFFSKEEHSLINEKPLHRVREIIRRYGDDKLLLFDQWCSVLQETV